jgi:3D (Asp-Asp-Asp) domain-containing protein
MVACATAGSTWMDEPMNAKDEEEPSGAPIRPPAEARSGHSSEAGRYATHVIGGEVEGLPKQGDVRQEPLRGKVLGTFRNTYYDFPSETDFAGDKVSLKDTRCGALAQVPKAFHDALCVQGSGILSTGRTVSFARRDCECADVCPRTGQKICFEALDALQYPWGRGAMGTAITPLLTVAVDDTVIPMGTGIYIPEFVGLPLGQNRDAVHDGCFIAQDRGLRVKGQHVDVFTGQASITKLWNQLVPSNRGVTVVVDNPRCTRAP